MLKYLIVNITLLCSASPHWLLHWAGADLEHRDLPHILCLPPHYEWHILAYPGPKSEFWPLGGVGFYSSATSRATSSPPRNAVMGKWTPPEAEVWFLVIHGWKWGCPSPADSVGLRSRQGEQKSLFQKTAGFLLAMRSQAQPSYAGTQHNGGIFLHSIIKGQLRVQI